MSAITLGSLSNREYDDYLNQKLDELERQADAYRTLLANKRMKEQQQPCCDEPDCEYYKHRQQPPRRRRSHRSLSFRGNQQRRSWNAYYLPEEHEQQQWTRNSSSNENSVSFHYSFEKNNRPRWHRRHTTSIPAYPPAPSFRNNWSFYADNTVTSHENDDDDDDESMNEMEILAAENAERNIIGTAYRASLDDISARPSPPPAAEGLAPEQQQETIVSPDGPTNTSSATPTEQTPGSSQVNSGSNTPTTTAINQQQQSSAQKKKRWWPLNYLFRRTPNSSSSATLLTTPSPTSQGTSSSTATQSASSSPSNNIKSIKTNGPLGDLLDPKQQEKIMDQLAVADPLVSENSSLLNDEAIKIASLDHIWIFRSSEHSLWIVFDYANQHKLTQHTQQLYHHHPATVVDQGVELFDSHIRNGQLPVLVLPSRQCGYYPTSFTGEQIASLHVICIPNSSNLQFVYRQQ